jgi:lipid biosynthesis B12-binding/radical SAM protein
MSRVLMISTNTSADPYPVYPIGMATVSAALAAAAHDVRQFDLLAQDGSDERLKEVIAVFDPEYVGISLRNIDTVDSCDPENRWYLSADLRLMKAIREATKAPVILGGPAFSIMPEEILHYLGGDFGVVGEGEHIICRLIDALVEKRPLPRITMSCDYDGPPDTMGMNPLWEPDLVRFYTEQSGMVNMVTKRGCPHRCAYCAYPAIEGGTFRYRAPEDVADHVQYLRDAYGIDTLYFTDSVFNDGEGHYIKIAEALVRRELNVKWTAFFRPARIDMSTWALLKRSGLYAVELGSDAASDAALSGLNKGFTFDDIYTFNECAVKARVPCAHYVMFGGPGETCSSIDEGLNNLSTLRNCMVMAFSGIRILPGTTLHTRAVEEGIIAKEASLLEPVYYFSPAINREDMNTTIKNDFHGHMDRVFPPSEGARMMKKMNSLGYRGLLWDRLINFGRN